MAMTALFLCVFILLELVFFCRTDKPDCKEHGFGNRCTAIPPSTIQISSSSRTTETIAAAAETTFLSTLSSTKTVTSTTAADTTTTFLASSCTAAVSLAASSVFSTRPETVQTNAIDSSTLSPVQQTGLTNNMTHSDLNSTLSLTAAGEYDTLSLAIGLGVAGVLVEFIGALVVAMFMFRRRSKSEQDTQVFSGHVNLSCSESEIQRASNYAAVNDNQCEGNNMKDKHLHNYYHKSLLVDTTDEVHIDIQTPAVSDGYDLARNPSSSENVDNYDKVADNTHYFILEKVDEQSPSESGTERQATDSNTYNTTDNTRAKKLTDGDTYSHLKKLEDVYNTSASTNQRMDTTLGTDTYAHLKGKDEVYNTTSDTACSHIPEITGVYSRLHL